MQMTMDQAMRPGMFNFARRSGGYVMRSEKRPAYGSSGSGGRKPKPPKAGAFYILMTLIISILIWPVGMVMLWRKKVRMQTGTKLLISLLTMCASVFMIVFLLTVRVEDERFTVFLAVQVIATRTVEPFDDDLHLAAAIRAWGEIV